MCVYIYIYIHIIKGRREGPRALGRLSERDRWGQH